MGRVGLLFLFMFSASVWALDCEPSAESCDFYACLEQNMPCGPLGYAQHFGGPLCVRYLVDESRAEERLAAWYPRVRLCLQQAVAALGPVNDCADLTSRAFGSHLECYLETGFCALSWWDKLRVLEIAGADALWPQTVRVSWEIQMACDRRHPETNSELAYFTRSNMQSASEVTWLMRPVASTSVISR